MKKFFTFAIMALMSATLTVGHAQSAVELAKQQKELNKINRELLNDKVAKDAKKQAKQYKKDGYQVPAGELSIEKQINNVMLKRQELMADEDGNATARFIIADGVAVGGTFNTARMAARANAQNEVATLLETQLVSAMQIKLDNQQTTSINATSVDKVHQRAKAITQAALTNAQTLLTIYKTLPNNNVEVHIQYAFDKKELKARLKRQLEKELEKEGDEELGEIVDQALANI